MEDIAALPTPLLAALVVLVVVQLTLEVWAVIDIVKRPKEQITGGNKVLWILLVVFVNLIGAIVYFAVGRAPRPSAEPGGPVATGSAAQNAIDTLYGPGGEQQ